MNVRKSAVAIGSLLIVMIPLQSAFGQPKPEVVRFEPFIWPSAPPADCPVRAVQGPDGDPFPGPQERLPLRGHLVSLLGRGREAVLALDGRLRAGALDGSREVQQFGERQRMPHDRPGRHRGERSPGPQDHQPGPRSTAALPITGRYPCGSLVYNGVWYYGTYCLAPDGRAHYGPISLQLALAGAVRRLPRTRRTSARPGRTRRTRRPSRSSARPACGATRSRSARPTSSISARTWSTRRTARPISSPTAPEPRPEAALRQPELDHAATRSTCSASRRRSRTSTTPRSTSSSPAATPRGSPSGRATSPRSSRSSTGTTTWAASR